MKRLLAPAFAVILLGGTAGSAVAAPNETPIGFVGACNMVASWPGEGPAQGLGVQPGGGMEQAMFGTPAYDRFGEDHKGNQGMENAVLRSGGNC